MMLRFQQGGTLPFTEYLPFTGLQTSQETQVPAASIGGTGEKQQDLLKLVSQLKGLPSDTGKLIEDLQDIYNEANLFTNGELDASDLTTTYLSTLQKMKYAEFNDAQFKKAEEDVRKNGGLHDYAIDESGRLIVQSQKTGKIKHMSLEDLYKQGQDGEYAPLTNSNLLYYRSQSPDFAFKNDFIDIVSNGIGHDKVTEILQKALGKVGSSTVGEDGYTARQQGEITKGLNILKGLVTQGKTAEDIWGQNGLLSLDGLYKTSSLTQDQKDQIKSVATYLWHTLPRNARTWLAVKSGNTTDPNKGAHDLMMTMLLASENTSYKFQADYQKDINVDGSKKSSSGDGNDKDKINPYISMQKQEQGTYSTFQLNSGTSNSMLVDGTVYGSIPDTNWNPVGNTSMSELFSKGLSGIVENMQGISFGNKVLSPEDLNNIMYDGGGGIMVTLPCKIINGARVVNLDVLDEYNKAREEMRTLNPQDSNYQEECGNILKQHGLYELLDSNGLPNKSVFGQFLVVNGYAVDKGNKLYKDNNYIEEVDTNDEGLMDLIQKSLSTDQKKSNYKIDTESWFESSDPDSFFATYDHVYKGSIYIPISNNEGQGNNAGGQLLPYDIMHSKEYQYQLEQKRRTAQSASASVL